jgi:hypothetical protein
VLRRQLTVYARLSLHITTFSGQPETAEVAAQIDPVWTAFADASMQTDSAPEVVQTEMAIQNEATNPKLKPKPVLVDSSMGTDPIPQEEVRIPLIAEFSRDRSTTLTQQDASLMYNSSGDCTAQPTSGNHQFLAPGMAEGNEGEETETGADTGTGTDAYQDARASMHMSTPAMSKDVLQSAGTSTDDFHYIATMTDVDYRQSSNDDTQSIRAMSGAASQFKPWPSFARPPPLPQKQYDSKSITAMLIEEPKMPEPKKPELKEMSMQTGPMLIPFPETGSPTFSCVGTIGGQQFQFIPPPFGSRISNPSIPASLAAAAPILPKSQSSVLRESTNGLHTRSSSDTSRRQCINSIISAMDEKPRSHAPSGNTLAVVDKTKPPMIMDNGTTTSTSTFTAVLLSGSEER